MEMPNSRKGSKKLNRSTTSEEKPVKRSDKPIFNKEGRRKPQTESLSSWKFGIGCVYTVSVALFQGFLFNVVKRSATPTFYAPAFVIWFRCLFRAFVFPIYALLRWKVFPGGDKASAGDSLSAVIRDGEKLYGDSQGPTRKFWRDMIFCVSLMIGSQWLSFLPMFAAREPGVLAALSTISIPLLYLISTLVFGNGLSSAKLPTPAILNLAGVSLLCLVEINMNPRWREALVMLVGGLFTASLQVAFRAKFRGRGGLAGLYFYVSLAASLMVLLMWPLVMYLKWTGIEYWDVRSLPWGQLITTSTMAMSVISIVNAAVVHLPQAFTSLHMLLIIPSAYWWERVFAGRQASSVELAGVAMAFAGGVGMVLKDLDWTRTKGQLGRLVTPWTQMLITFTGMGITAKRQKQKRL
ncbi:hypothetical protein RvY_14986 [Ramazzottius varieornatus]|uniref:EamA domain-containing protein n=1 Tax=Ramazzottius varieornatus TaxID=947166 RepID=A0A1D1VUZ3_RAMVA|nr:hypothetical protein RvY_14986 [Ramazzottius varieornatus]